MREFLMAFVQDTRVRTIFGLIILDVALGLIAAIKTGTFDWKKVAQFYKTNIVPYVLGYGVVYLTVPLITESLILEEYQGLVNGAVLTAFWGALLMGLGASIWENLKKLLPGWPPESQGMAPYR